MKLALAFFVFCVFAGSQCHELCAGTDIDGLGCFTLAYPFTNTRYLPASPENINTTFLLYTRESRATPQLLNPRIRSTIIHSNFNANRLTKIIIHGFLQDETYAFIINTTNALLDTAPMNVIVVAWKNGAAFPYNQAVANTRVVGAQTALLLAKLAQHKDLEVTKVHIIGHSLGAHVAGYAGSRTPGLDRITGLDPAQPGFHNYTTSVRLDTSDARFVDVIHTDARPYVTFGGYGIIEPIGHVDFYPNSGREQPGCNDENSFVDVLGDFVGDGMLETETSMSCSHERSTQLFLASILHSVGNESTQCLFRAVPCESYESFLRGDCLNCLPNICPIMGLEAPTSRSRGVHYLRTTDGPNFCGFPYFVTVYISDTSMAETEGQLDIKLTGHLGSAGWTRVLSGPIEPGSNHTIMVLSPNDIGNPIEVKVRALYSSSYISWITGWTWNTNRATLSKVKVDSVMEFVTHFFCQPNWVLPSNETITATTVHFNENDCIWT